MFAADPPWYALFLCAMGRHDEGLRVVTTALAVDPRSLGLRAAFRVTELEDGCPLRR
jgi:hypothetical protein